MMRGELRKLRSPGVLLSVLGAIAALFVLTGLAQLHDAAQWSVYTTGKQQLADPATREVYCQDAKSEEQCDDVMAQESAWNEQFKDELISEHPYGAATQHPVAAAGVVAGWMTSLFGLVMAGLLAAVLVGTEWSWGTAGVVLARTPARWRYVLAKGAILWLALLGLTVVLWAALVTVSPLLRTLYDVPPAAADWSNGSYATQRLAHAAPVLTLFSILATGVSLLVRHSMAAFAVTIACGLGSIATSASRDLLAYSPAYWLASWMDFLPEGSWTDHVWPSLFPLGSAAQPVPPDAVTGLVAILGCQVALVIATVAVFRRRDVRV
jgi:ABC-type transport system involved in multi-copper enzyme maturation permease subunit